MKKKFAIVLALFLIAVVCSAGCIDPEDPVDPIDPVDPVDPVDPITPVDPVDPVVPTEEYSVMFMLNYGDAGAYTAETVKAGETVSKPASPTRSGYTFNGWFTAAEGGAAYDFTQPVNADVTLYAQWKKKSSSSSGSSSSGGSNVPSTPSCSHDYVDEVTTPAGCETDGLRTFTCSKCGDSYTEVIPATNHNIPIEWTVSKAATCFAAGEETRTCANGCGLVESRIISQLTHEYENGVFCKHCGESKPSEPTVEPGHTHSLEHSESTPGVHTHKCTDPGCTAYTSEADCTFVKTIDFTVTPANATYKCSVCNFVYYEEYEAQVGTKYFTSLSEAITEAKNQNLPLVLLNNTGTADARVSISEDVTINANDKEAYISYVDVTKIKVLKKGAGKVNVTLEDKQAAFGETTDANGLYNVLEVTLADGLVQVYDFSNSYTFHYEISNDNGFDVFINSYAKSGSILAKLVEAGTFTFSGGIGADITFVGLGEGTVIDIGTSSINSGSHNLVFEDINFTTTNGNYKGLQHITSETYINCNFLGQFFFYGATSVFTDCTFEQVSSDAYNVWTYGSSSLTFTDCTFNSAGKSVLIYNEGAPGSDVTFTDCEFIASSPVDGKAAIEIDSSLLNGNNIYNVVINSCTDTGFGKGSVSGLTLWNNKNGKKAIITVDGKRYSSTNYDEVLEETLRTDGATNIVVDLSGSVSFDVTAWQTLEMLASETITINGNWHTLTFDQQNSDWNNIATSGAKLILNNVTINSSGHNDGPWNRHDINFACEVELNNVISEKALAFKSGATLNNVTVDDPNNSDTYAIWIQPNGQTITINGLLIDMLDCTDGRGIKIDEQYVDSPAKVTLSITDATFKTEEKSAILVKSAAGADITLSDIDISGVAADSINAVWVDEASTAYYDLVTVEGGSKSKEPSGNTVYITSAAAMFAFANDVNVNGKSYSGKTLLLDADIDLNNQPWTPIGQTGATEFKGVFDGQGHTISNLNIDSSAQTGEHYSSGLFGWIESSNYITIKNVNVSGAVVKGHHNVAVIAGYLEGNSKVENCHVSDAELTSTHANDDACGDKTGIIAGYAASEVTIKDCSAKSSTVSSGRDAGQIVGAAKAHVVSNCQATAVTVSATGDCTGANVRGELIGRVL